MLTTPKILMAILGFDPAYAYQFYLLTAVADGASSCNTADLTQHSYYLFDSGISYKRLDKLARAPMHTQARKQSPQVAIKTPLIVSQYLDIAIWCLKVTYFGVKGIVCQEHMIHGYPVQISISSFSNQSQK